MQEAVLYFTDPVLRGPTVGCMLMSLGAGVAGVIIYLKKQALLGEALSHTAYPGVIAAIALFGMLSCLDSGEADLSLLILLGAFITSVAGLFSIRWLESRMKIKSDAALCFVLSVFFGAGLTFASQIQFTHSLLYQQAIAYLYGQAATMTDEHIAIYGGLAAVIAGTICIFYKEIQIICYDREYAKSIGIQVRRVDAIIYLLIVLAIIIGIRSVGVVLMAAMLIAPASAARQFSHNLKVIFFLAGIFGLLSGFLGNYLSHELSIFFSAGLNGERFSLPTGPMIVLASSCISLLSLLFAPERGWVVRLLAQSLYRAKHTDEDAL